MVSVVSLIVTVCLNTEMRHQNPRRVCIFAIHFLKVLDSTANSANFHLNWAGLAVLFSRQLPNSSHDFSITPFFYYLIKNQQTKIVLTFLTNNISGIGGVKGLPPILIISFLFRPIVCFIILQNIFK